MPLTARIGAGIKDVAVVALWVCGFGTLVITLMFAWKAAEDARAELRKMTECAALMRDSYPGERTMIEHRRCLLLIATETARHAAR